MYSESLKNISVLRLDLQDRAAFFFTVLLHLILLSFICFSYKKASFDQTLSFSFSTMAVSSSLNKVTSDVSVAKKEKTEILEKKEVVEISDDKKVLTKDLVQKEIESDQSYDSIARSAVLSPDVEASYDAASLNNKAPKYPEISRELGEQGVVTLRVLVGSEGDAKIVELKESSGFERLDLAVLETVKSWRFIAAKKSGRIVASWVHIPIRFALE